MWLITRYGSFVVTPEPPVKPRGREPSRLVIQARTRADLENLRRRFAQLHTFPLRRSGAIWTRFRKTGWQCKGSINS
jgi:hypothetical protein